MHFESLSNELLLDLFEYLSPAHLLFGFYGLNERTNSLLSDYFRIHGLDFRSIAKNDFYMTCRHLSSIANHITILHLSEKDDTPGQIDQFYSSKNTLRQFTYLKSLSLYQVYSEMAMNKILLDLPYLINLSKLMFEQCFLSHNETQCQNLVDTVWRLPRLVHCYIDIEFKPQIYLPVSTVISSTMEYLTIKSSAPEFSQMAVLLGNTPNLRHLSVDFHFNSSDDLPSSTMTPLVTLHVSFFSLESDLLENFLKTMPNLYFLKVDLPDTYIDGKTWQYIIQMHLVKLKTFQFRMNNELDNDNECEQQIDDIVNLFRCSFWLKEYKLFVECDWNPQSNQYCLYSLPYAFNNFFLQSPIISKSTYPVDSKYHEYTYVRQLTCKAAHPQQLNLHHIQIKRVHELCLYLPINGYVLSMIPTLKQLTVLNLILNDQSENINAQLEALLDVVPHVSQLRLRNSPLNILKILSIRQNNLKFSQLDLMWSNKWYTHDECIILSQLLLHTSCKVLSMDVTNLECICVLVTMMKNLRALTIRCQNENCDAINWLEHRLPSS